MPILGSGIAWFICIYISRGIFTVGPSSKAGKINCPPRSLLFKILCLISLLMLTHTSAKRLLSIDSRGTKHVKYENKYKNSCGTKHAMHYWLYNTVVLCFTNFHQRPCDPKDVLTLSGKTRAGALMSLWKGAFSLSTSNSTRKPTPNVITKWRQYNSFCWYWNQKKFGIQFSSCTASAQKYII